MIEIFCWMCKSDGVINFRMELIWFSFILIEMDCIKEVMILLLTKLLLEAGILQIAMIINSIIVYLIRVDHHKVLINVVARIK